MVCHKWKKKIKMKDKDWDIKVILQKDNNFIEHVLNSRLEGNEEDRMIDKLDGIEENSREDARFLELLTKAEYIKSKLTEENLKVLNAFISCKGYEKLSLILGCSTSTAWKKWQKVLRQIEEIKNEEKEYNK